MHELFSLTADDLRRFKWLNIIVVTGGRVDHIDIRAAGQLGIPTIPSDLAAKISLEIRLI